MKPEASNQEVAATFLAALRNMDWDSMRSLMEANIVRSLSGESILSEEAHGLEAVIQRAQTIASFGLNFGYERKLLGGRAAHNSAKKVLVVLEMLYVGPATRQGMR
jgi:hypothetical protein